MKNRLGTETENCHNGNSEAEFSTGLRREIGR